MHLIFLKNVLWSLGGNVGVQLLGLLTNIVLARLLTPEIFGIVAITMVFITLIHNVQEAGLSSVIVHSKEISTKLVATTFYLNIIFSSILCLLIAVLAPIIANFYGHSQIENLLYYSIIGLFIGSFGITFRGLLTRSQDFKTLTIVDLASEISGILLTFILVFYELYYLAVSVRVMSRPAFRAIIMMVICGFKEIKAMPSIRLLPQILPYSLSVLGVRMTNYLKNNIDYLIAGKYIGSQGIGFYTLSFQWSTIAKFYISGSVAKVLFPEVSRHQTDLEKVRTIFLSVVEKLMFLILPFCVILALVAQDFILTIYGKQWTGAVPILQILMISGALTSIGTLVSRVYQGLGRPGIELKITLISIITFIPFIIVGIAYGVVGLAFAVLFHTLIFDSILIYFVLKLMKLKLTTFIKSVLPVVKSVISMTILYSIFQFLFPMEEMLPIISLIVKVVVGIVSYILMTAIFNNKFILQFLRKQN